MTDSRSRTATPYRIDLDKSRAPRAFRGDQNLWQEDLRRIERLVHCHVEILKEDREKDICGETDPNSFSHLSIAIFGPSGSGKSSLLRTLADKIVREHRKDRQNQSIYSLPVIDPTTWSVSDQFLYSFLATALEEERKIQDRKEHGYPQGLSPVQLAFQDVNEYLRVVDDPGSPDEHDPLGLSLQRLERHTSGLRLRTAISRFVESLAKEFGADVILLPVDDLDMAPDHLVASLHAYQSYLMHPQLVPVFTFTDRMPEELIEAYYVQRLGDTEARRRAEKDSERLTINEQLAVQFLARCFPVRNRIRLGPAPARVQRAIFDYRTEDQHTKEKPVSTHVLELLMISSFLLFGHPDREDAHKVRAALRPSTLRRQFQIVDAMADSRLHVFHSGQIMKMALAPVKETQPVQDFTRLRKAWARDGLLEHGHRKGYLDLAERFSRLDIDATWATVFNGVTWSLLNVHRDTLRELGLFLEDLFSWSPKELRSVVLDRILCQDGIIRRMVIDRWFNRTDYRRSQVLSLLAANIFRPWMSGEEPQGDDEIAIYKQLAKEMKDKKSTVSLHTSAAKGEEIEAYKKISECTFSAIEGLLWFLNVTIGFYLPQIMARNWTDALSVDEPVKERMSGNGWDLHHGPLNAMRIADAKKEIFSFGMLFLDFRGYRHALEAMTYGKVASGDDDYRLDQARGGNWKNNSDVECNEKEMKKRHLLLRIWSACGCSRGRYWAALSLWRGLGFIGQVLETGLRKRDAVKFIIDYRSQKAPQGKAYTELEQYDDLVRELSRLIRSYCLAGLMPGSFIDRDADESRLRHGVPRWEPLLLKNEIGDLAGDLLEWLLRCWDDRIYPMPAGNVWIGWHDCFIRRIHGEYILGNLWPRLNSAYLEEHTRDKECRCLARRRSLSEEEIIPVAEGELELENFKYEERFNWTASVAASAWSDILLEYWQGCPPILRLLLSCPVFYKSQEHFEGNDSIDLGRIFAKLKSDKNNDQTASDEVEEDEILAGGHAAPGSAAPEGTNGQEGKADEKNLKSGKDDIELNTAEQLHYDWLERLHLHQEAWKELVEELWNADGALKIPALVADELCIERVRVDLFAPHLPLRHSVSFEPTKVTIGEPYDQERSVTVESSPVRFPKLRKKDNGTDVSKVKGSKS